MAEGAATRMELADSTAGEDRRTTRQSEGDDQEYDKNHTGSYGDPLEKAEKKQF